MKPNGAVNIANNLQKKGISVARVLGDDDATTISHLRKHVNPDMEKTSDLNHVKKNLGNRLYALREAGHKEMTTKTVKHIQKCFSYAIAQNKGNVNGFQASVRALIPHLYNDHTLCTDQNWCHHKKEPGRRYSSLPRGQPLADQGCRRKLEEVFETYTKQAGKFVQLGSTQRNENFNQVVTTKHPKNKHFASSESLDYRVSAAVCQTNNGHGFVSEVMEAAELSPGKHTAAYSARLDKRKARDQQRRRTVVYKLRRRLFKDTRGLAENALQVREGTSCQSAVSQKLTLKRLRRFLSLPHNNSSLWL